MTAQPRFGELGHAHDVATVSGNGKEVKARWRAACQVHLSDALRPGVNMLEAEIINRWPKPLSCHKQPRTTAIVYAARSPDRTNGSLLPFGLLGRVHLVVERIRTGQ